MNEEIEFQKGPEEVEVASPFGSVWIKVMDWGVYVDANSNGRSIRINGVDYSFVLRLQYGDGDRLELEKSASDPYGFHAIYGVRLNWAGRVSYANSDISSAARVKVREILIPFVQKWLDENPALIAEARYAGASNDFRAADADYQKALIAVEDARVAVDKAWAIRQSAKDDLRDIQRASAWRKG